jgi:hypothetical protein
MVLTERVGDAGQQASSLPDNYGSSIMIERRTTGRTCILKKAMAATHRIPFARAEHGHATIRKM